MKYHPDVAGGAEAAARMAAINAAWEQIGEPARARRLRPRAPARRGHGPRPRRRRADRATAAGAGHDRARRPGHRRAPPGDRLARLDERSLVGRRRLRRLDAQRRTAPARPARRPATPSGSVLNFGRYAGWSLGEIARADLEYIEWLDRMPIGRPYRDEIDAILRRTGRRRSAEAEASDRRGLFRRR